MDDIYVQPGEEGFKNEVLDEYLAKGYYRMKQQLFTTDSIPNGFYGKYPLLMSVFWLRTVLQKIKWNKSATAIRKKCRGFSFRYLPAIINDEVENLFQLYRTHVEFETYEKCSACLQVTEPENPFNSMMIEIRDDDLLIAVGYFDVGNKSIAGILNFYHPEYQKYSLGKFLMLKKIDWAFANDIYFYYTGYISVSSSKFDYKIFPSAKAVEVYFPIEKEWKPFNLKDKGILDDYVLEFLL